MIPQSNCSPNDKRNSCGEPNELDEQNQAKADNNIQRKFENNLPHCDDTPLHHSIPDRRNSLHTNSSIGSRSSRLTYFQSAIDYTETDTNNNHNDYGKVIEFDNDCDKNNVQIVEDFDEKIENEEEKKKQQQQQQQQQAKIIDCQNENHNSNNGDDDDEDWVRNEKNLPIMQASIVSFSSQIIDFYSAIEIDSDDYDDDDDDDDGGRKALHQHLEQRFKQWKVEGNGNVLYAQIAETSDFKSLLTINEVEERNLDRNIIEPLPINEPNFDRFRMRHWYNSAIEIVRTIYKRSGSCLYVFIYICLMYLLFLCIDYVLKKLWN